MNSTDSGIKAFLEHYGVISRKTLQEFFDMDERMMLCLENRVLGTSLHTKIKDFVKKAKIITLLSIILFACVKPHKAQMYIDCVNDCKESFIKNIPVLQLSEAMIKDIQENNYCEQLCSEYIFK